MLGLDLVSKVFCLDIAFLSCELGESLVGCLRKLPFKGSCASRIGDNT